MSSISEEANKLADFILFTQRSCILNLSSELNEGKVSYPQFFLLTYLASFFIGPAADEADKHRKLAEAQAGPRPQLYHLFRARLHLFAATDAAGDPGKAQAHRQRAEDVLAQFRGDPRFAPLAGIYGGSLEVFRNMIAQHVLGLGKPNYSPPAKKVS